MHKYIYRSVNARLCQLFVITALAISSFTAQGGLIFINEIHYDNTGSDVNEAIELAGSYGLSTETMFIRFYTGSNNTVYKTLSLKDKKFTNFNNGVGFLSLPISPLQNGPADGIALFEGNRLIQFLSYEGSLTITDDLLNNVTSLDIGIHENSSIPETGSMQLVGEGKSYEDFTWQHVSTNTFGNINQDQRFNAVAEPQLSTLLWLPLIYCFRRFSSNK